jgi:hypothetical protein
MYIRKQKFEGSAGESYCKNFGQEKLLIDD